jgi:RNA polymerase sigma factor (sigma-70 family)
VIWLQKTLQTRLILMIHRKIFGISKEDALEILGKFFTKKLTDRVRSKIPYDPDRLKKDGVSKIQAFIIWALNKFLVDEGRIIEINNQEVNADPHGDNAADLALRHHPANGLNPEEELEQREALENAINSLTGNYRNIWIMHNIEKLSFEEIANRLGLKADSVAAMNSSANGLFRDEIISYYRD